MDLMSDMHPDMRLMSYAETDVPAEVVSGTDESYFVPLPAFMDTLLANYNGCPSQSSSTGRAHRLKTLSHWETSSDFAG